MSLYAYSYAGLIFFASIHAYTPVNIFFYLRVFTCYMLLVSCGQQATEYMFVMLLIVKNVTCCSFLVVTL